jgi:hypothetical protein
MVARAIAAGLVLAILPLKGADGADPKVVFYVPVAILSSDRLLLAVTNNGSEPFVLPSNVDVQLEDSSGNSQSATAAIQLANLSVLKDCCPVRYLTRPRLYFLQPGESRLLSLMVGHDPDIRSFSVKFEDGTSASGPVEGRDLFTPIPSTSVNTCLSKGVKFLRRLSETNFKWATVKAECAGLKAGLYKAELRNRKIHFFAI